MFGRLDPDAQDEDIRTCPRDQIAKAGDLIEPVAHHGAAVRGGLDDAEFLAIGDGWPGGKSHVAIRQRLFASRTGTLEKPRRPVEMGIPEEVSPVAASRWDG